MNGEILEEAARWYEAQSHDDMDWLGFTAWLASDPRHREAFDDIALLDEDVTTLRRLHGDALDLSRSESRQRRGRTWVPFALGGTALVAALIATVIVTHEPPSRIATAWSGGANQGAVRFAAGSRVVLARGSMLSGDPASRTFRLQGRASFTVRHNPKQPLEIAAGDYVVEDVGTRFEVAAYGDAIEVQVREGEVAVTKSGAAGAVSVTAGHALVSDGASRPGELRNIAGHDVGSWRTGQLRYENIPLGIVAGDVSRYVGMPILLSPSAARRRLTGVIAIGSPDAMIGSLESITGLHGQKMEAAVRLEPRS